MSCYETLLREIEYLAIWEILKYSEEPAGFDIGYDDFDHILYIKYHFIYIYPQYKIACIHLRNAFDSVHSGTMANVTNM